MRRLFKAEAAGKITFGRIVVIDRDPGCAAAALASDRVRIDAASWSDWLAANLSHAAMGDHLVPYHWAPHVLLDWLVNDLDQHGVTLERQPLAAGSPAPTEGPDVRPQVAELGDLPARPPVALATAAGDVALSYAEWLCPPACIEPALCPHTRGPKSWSLASELARAPRSFVFPCLHLAHGVGTIPVSSIFAVRSRVAEALRGGEIGPDTPLWISSASHCHGLAARVRVRPEGASP